MGSDICWKQVAAPIQELNKFCHSFLLWHVSKGSPFLPEREKAAEITEDSTLFKSIVNSKNTAKKKRLGDQGPNFITCRFREPTTFLPFTGLKPIGFSALFCLHQNNPFRDRQCLYEISHIPLTLLQILNYVQKLPRYKWTLNIFYPSSTLVCGEKCILFPTN